MFLHAKKRLAARLKSPVAWPFFTNQEKPFFVSWLAVGCTEKYLSPSSVSHASFRVGSRRRGLRRSLRDGVRSFLYFDISSFWEGLGGPKIGLGHRKMFKNSLFSRPRKRLGDLCERYADEKSSFRAARAQFAARSDQSLRLSR